MSLPDFIEANLDLLMGDSSEYARTLSQASGPLSMSSLRTSVSDVLMQVAADMRKT
jgi:hypothetical protein